MAELALADDRVLTVAEAADELRVHARTVYRLIAEGALPVFPVRARGYRLLRSDVLAYAMQQRDLACRPPRVIGG